MRSWQRVTNGEGPCQRSLHVAAIWRDKLLVFGGYDGSNRVNDCWEFDFTKRQWSPIRATSGSAPSPRDRHVGVVWGSSFYVFGGFDGQSRVNDFHELSFGSYSWAPVRALSGMAPTPRHSHAAIVHEDSLYVFGGYDGSYRCDFHEFNFATCSWSPIAGEGRAPRARYRATCVCVDGRMYLFGGHDGSRHLNDVHVFDIQRRRWAELQTEGPAPMPRDSHAAVAHGRSMYVFGGSTGAAMNDFHELRLDVGTWAPVLAHGHHRGGTSTASTGQGTTFGGDGADAGGGGSVNRGGGIQHVGQGETRRRVYAGVSRAADGHGAAVGHVRERDTAAASQHERGPGGMAAQGTTNATTTNQPPNSAATARGEAVQPPGARFCHVAVVYEDSIFVFGGYDGGSRLNDFLEFPLGRWWGGDEADMYLDDEDYASSCRSSSSAGPTSLVADLAELVDSPVLSDVCFVLDDGARVRAHKVLCLRCPYFRAMLGADSSDDADRPRFLEASASEIRISDTTKPIFLCVLEYLYTDHCRVDLEVAMDLFQAADRFGVDRLKKMCEAKMLASISVDNASSIFHAADQYAAKHLRDKCLRFILHNFDDVTQTPAFECMARLNVDLVFDILRARTQANPFARQAPPHRSTGASGSQAQSGQGLGTIPHILGGGTTGGVSSGSPSATLSTPALLAAAAPQSRSSAAFPQPPQSSQAAAAPTPPRAAAGGGDPAPPQPPTAQQQQQQESP